MTDDGRRRTDDGRQKNYQESTPLRQPLSPRLPPSLKLRRDKLAGQADTAGQAKKKKTLKKGDSREARKLGSWFPEDRRQRSGDRKNITRKRETEEQTPTCTGCAGIHTVRAGD